MISIIVPVYMVEKYLEPCIESILTQSFSDFELLLIDDGSKDRCPMICDKYARKDWRIKVVHQDNQGLSAARNTGIDLAKGDYITFIDSDDVVTKDHLKILYTLLRTNNADISMSGYRPFEGDMFKEEGPFKSYVVANRDSMCDFIYKIPNSYKVAWVSSWGKLYKSSLFAEIRFPINRLHEDQFTTYRLYLKSKRNVYTTYPTYGYRQRKDSIMHSRNVKEALDDIQAVEEAVKCYQEEGLKKSEKDAKTWLIYLESKCALIGGNNGNWHSIPRKYRMNIYDAIRFIEKCQGKNEGEYIAYSLYPNAVKKYALLKKLHLLH